MKNYKILIAIAILVLLLASCSNSNTTSSDSITGAYSQPATNNSTVIDNVSPATDGATSAEEHSESTSPEGEADKLVSINTDNVTIDGNPVLWDYLNGCLSWHTELNLYERGGVDAILLNTNAPSYAYLSEYVAVDEFTIPPCGSCVVVIDKMSYADVLELVKSARTSMNCGDGWVLYILDYGPVDTSELTSSTLELAHVNDYCSRLLQSDSGIPSSWLRQSWIASTMSSLYDINMYSSFWDIYNYNQKVYFTDPDGKVVTDAYAKITGEYTYTVTISDMLIEDISLTELAKIAYMYGYNIDQPIDEVVIPDYTD